MSGHQSFFPPPDDSLPRPFGRYTLLRKIARGGMAEVYLGLQRGEFGLEKLVVVKCLLPNLSEETRFIAMFLDEARTSATLTHPNIAQVFDVGEVDGTYFIAMEFVEGRDLRSLRRARRAKRQTALPFAHAVYITTQLLAGLDYAHEKKDLGGTPLNIVHRDISPQNVLLDFSGSVKVVDFGVAKSAMQLGEKTGIGELKGKVAYMSPEQAKGQDIDWRTDLFAATVLLFEMTTGKRLFYGKSDVDTLHRIYAREYPRPSKLIVNYPEELEEIVLRGLCKDRRLRYQSASEMQIDLQRFAERAGLTLSQSEFADWVREELKVAYQELQGILAEVHLHTGRPESVDERLARRVSSRPPPLPTETESAALRDSQGPQSADNPTLRGSVHTVASEPRVYSRRVWPYLAAASIAGAGAIGAVLAGWLPPPPGTDANQIRQLHANATRWAGQTLRKARGPIGDPASNASAVVPAVAPATLILDIKPSNASVSLDYEPLTSRKVRVSRTQPYRLSVSAPGHEPKVLQVLLKKDSERVSVTLRPLEETPSGQPPHDSTSD